MGAVAFSQLSLKQINNAVAQACNVNPKHVVGKSRKMELVNARHIAMFLCREMTSSSLISIGRFFGGRDHSTVIHGCRAVEERAQKDSALSNTITTIKNELN